MNGHSIISRRTRLRTLALVAACVLPATSGGPALAESSTANRAELNQADFSKSFAALPKPNRNFDAAAGAVDITTIEAPVETTSQPALRTIASGIASYYGKRFAGRPTASGERFNPGDLTAAHKTLPFGTRIQVTNPSNGKVVTVRINDRGPYAHGRLIDLSHAAAAQIGLVARGHGNVELALLDS